jgi:2-succinyl-5-enolpyruvyl-6-hydroxy-3-cyclohexene-1-carboxylate synthase
MLSFEKKQSQESINNTNAQNFISELVKSGVRHFCIGSGRRSIILAHAINTHPLAELYTHFDERALGFFALGIAKAQNKPTALLVTSGTALANLYPSIIEARMSHTPLIILAANRPEEMIDSGSNQTIDQTKIFAPYIQHELSLNFSDAYLNSSHFEKAASRLYHLATTYDVSLINAAFREPLTCSATPIKVNETPTKTTLTKTTNTLESESLYEISHKINNAKNPLIIVGEIKDGSSLIFKLAEQLQAPLFLDILCNLRNQLEHPCHIPFFEQIISSERSRKIINPDLVLHFGKRCVSKKLLAHLKPNEYLQIDASSDRLDPQNLVTERVCINPQEFCSLLIDKVRQKPENTMLKSLKSLSTRAKSRFYEYVHTYKELDELYFFYTLMNHPIDEYQMFFGNSMPIRYANTLFFPYSQIEKVFANRGSSGIDGNIATALGLHSQATGPTICILGDLTALYDFNSFMIDYKNPLPILFIVFNNHEGGIFHHFDTGLDKKRLEECVSLKHTTDFKSLAKSFNLQYFCPEKRENLESQLICALNSQAALMEIKVDAKLSASHFKELQKKIEKSLVSL